MINILITAGGTSEPIDRVRNISNTGTGRLGSLIADRLALEASVDKIFYVCAHHSVHPSSDRITCIEIRTVADLQTAVTNIAASFPIDAVIHSMAVSDYRVRSITTPENLAKLSQNDSSRSSYTEDDILNAIVSSDIRADTEKLSSQIRSPLILLEQTPKILPLIRELLPKAVIIGFKLLSQVSESELLDTAYRLLVKNGCDFVLANDFSQINGDHHEAYLMDSAKNIQTFQTKQEIANGIAAAVLKEVQNKT